MEISVSQKQKDHLLHDGYRLRRDKSLSDGRTAWRCSRKDCSGRVSRVSRVSLRREQDHYELKIEWFRAGVRHPEASKSKYVRLTQFGSNL